MAIERAVLQQFYGETAVEALPGVRAGRQGLDILYSTAGGHPDEFSCVLSHTTTKAVKEYVAAMDAYETWQRNCGNNT